MQNPAKSMHRIKSLSTLLGCMLIPLHSIAATDTYRIDSGHSFANFSIRHVVSKTSGTFPDIKGTMRIDPDRLENSSVEATINLLSVDTRHEKRDAHIKKEEYLDVAKMAEMQFVSSKISSTGNNMGVITGVLTLHGISKEISFPFKVLGFGADPWGGWRTGIEAKTSIKASDFGYGWALKPGAPVGDDIEITLLIEGIKQADEVKLTQ